MATNKLPLDVITERLVDAVLSETFLKRDELTVKCRAIIRAWIKTNERPSDYDKPKTESGKLQRIVEQRNLEVYYWRDKLRDQIGEDKMKPLYSELTEQLTGLGYVKSL
jgi:hypothetical protein